MKFVQKNNNSLFFTIISIRPFVPLYFKFLFSLILIFFNLISCIQNHPKSKPIKKIIHLHENSIGITAYYTNQSSKIRALFLNALHPTYNKALSKVALNFAILSVPNGYTKELWEQEKKTVAFEVHSDTSTGWEIITASWNSRYAEQGLGIFFKLISNVELDYNNWETLKNKIILKTAENEQNPSVLFENRQKLMLNNSASVVSLTQLKQLDFFSVKTYWKQTLKTVAHSLFIVGNLKIKIIKKYVNSFFHHKLQPDLPFWFPPQPKPTKSEYVNITLPLQNYAIISCGYYINPAEYDLWKFTAQYYIELYPKSSEEIAKVTTYNGPHPYLIFTWYGKVPTLEKNIQKFSNFLRSNRFSSDFLKKYKIYSTKLQQKYHSNPKIILNKLVFDFKYALIQNGNFIFKIKNIDKQKIFTQWKKLLNTSKCVISAPSGFENIKPF